MLPVVFYVNSLYFQQQTKNWDVVFFNLSLDSELGILSVA